MSSGQQVIHGLHRRQEDGKFCFRLLFRHGESEIQFLTAGDQILEDLIDRVLISTRSSSRRAGEPAFECGSKIVARSYCLQTPGIGK